MKRIRRAFLSLLLAVCLFLSLLALPAAADAPFADVPESAWYAESVCAAWENGLITGTDETTFSPAGRLTAAQAITLAARLNQRVLLGTVTLENDPELWYAPYVAYAVGAGIIAEGAYDSRMQEAITRSDFAAIFAASLPDSEFAGINRIGDGAIPDVSMADPNTGAVYRLYRAGVLTGDEAHLFHPESTISRAEAAAILARIFLPSLRAEFLLDTDAPAEEPLPGSVPSDEELAEALRLLNDSLTAETVLRILDVCSADCAFFIRDALECGEDVDSWLYSGDNIDNINTVVHEEFHAYSFRQASGKQAIFTEGGQAVIVPYTDVFESSRMSVLIPESLHTFRFGTYVGEGSGLTSNLDGVYGLLNEFDAYRLGQEAVHALLPLVLRDIRENDNTDRAYEYFAAYSNNRSAYAEFLFFTLRYMLYARENQPEVYDGILANPAYLNAFRFVQTRFEALIALSDGNVEEIVAALNDRGHQAYCTDEYLYIDRRGRGGTGNDYFVLTAELEKSDCADMLHTMLDAAK